MSEGKNGLVLLGCGSLALSVAVMQAAKERERERFCEVLVDGVQVAEVESFSYRETPRPVDLSRYLVPQGPKPAKAFRVWRSTSKKRGSR